MVGNIANASPIGDTLPYLLAIGAQLEIQGPTEIRIIDINNFYTGYKKFDLAENEIITFIHLPKPAEKEIHKIYKVSKRKDLDICCINASFVMGLGSQQKIETIRVAFGGIAATPIRLENLESFLHGKTFDSATIDAAGVEILKGLSPLSDVRGTANYRKLLAKNLLRKFFAEVSSEREL